MEIREAYRQMGIVQDATSEPAGWPAVKEWRKVARVDLLDKRIDMDKAVRRERAQRAIKLLTDTVDFRPYTTLGIYWPIRGEIDVRTIAKRHLQRGGEVALPVVVSKDAPVEFWRWYPGIEMRRGFWNIPVPAQSTALDPDVLIVPLVGFDRAGYRLGYGGGYYDRTLAAANPKPFCIGLGYAAMELPTIYPQPHDIPMDTIATDEFVRPVAKRA